MAPRSSVRVRVRPPTTASIPSSYKIPSTTRSLVRSLSRLSRNSLIDLALEWLQWRNQVACAPYLSANRDAEEEAEEDYLHTPADTIEDLRELYSNLRNEPGTKRDVVDRLLDGDWRRGFTLQQLAMVDFHHLQHQPASLKWTALKLVPLTSATKEASDSLKPHRQQQTQDPFPRMHPSAFLQALQHHISPLVKAHYHLHRMPSPHNLTILRIYVADTPYDTPMSSTQAHFTDAARTLYLAFPDTCPYIYVAVSGSGGGGGNNNTSVMPKVDVAALKRIVIESVPKALSRPQQRYALETTALTAKNLSTMCVLRGNGRGGASQGAYSIFADAKADDGPLAVVRSDFAKNVVTKNEIDAEVGAEDLVSGSRKRKVLGERDANIIVETAEEQKKVKRRKFDVAKRFGTTGLPESKQKAPIDRLHIRLEADLILCEDESARARSTTSSSPAPEPQSTAITARRSTRPKKGSLLDTFNPQKNQSEQQPSYLAAHSRIDQNQNRTSAPLTLTFTGTDVFAGIRKLAEMSFVDLDEMPAWMTGEEGVSTALVTRNGDVVGGMGGGA